MKITVSAPEGAFPEGATLTAARVERAAALEAIDQAIDGASAAEANVAARYTFDVKVLDAMGQEVQPNAAAGKVSVRFERVEAPALYDEVTVYHTDDNMTEAEALATEVKSDTTASGEQAVAAKVETSGFSYYTVEFTYNDLQYVMEGDTTIKLSQIQEKVGLPGTVSAVGFSDPTLVSFSQCPDGDWDVTALKAFSTTETLTLVVDGVEYVVTVTDADIPLEGSKKLNILVYLNDGTYCGSLGSRSYYTEYNDTYAYHINPHVLFPNSSFNNQYEYVSFSFLTMSTSGNQTNLTGSASGGAETSWSVLVKVSDDQFYKDEAYNDYIGEYTIPKSTVNSSNQYLVCKITCKWRTNTVTYDANAGSDPVSGLSSTSATVNKGSSVTLPTPSRSGHVFNGWYTETSAGTRVGGGGSSYTPTENVTLHAQWSVASATAPTVSPVSGASLTYGYSSGSGKVSVSATAPSGHALSYQWYDRGTTYGNSGGTAISGATSSSYTVPTGKSAGTYYYYCVVTAKRTDNDLTATTTSDVAKVTVSKATGSVTAPTAKNLTYNGSPQELVSAGSSTTGTIQYKLGSGSYSTSIPTATNAGTYTVYYKVVGDANHNDVGENGVSVTIAKKPLTITADSASKTYDGAALTKNGYTSSGLVSGHTATATVTGSQTNVGSSNNVPSAATIKSGGTDVTANYAITYENGTLTVNKATTNTVTVSIEGWTYGDTPKSPTSTATFGTPTYTYSDSLNGTYTSEVPTTAGTWYVKATVAETANYAAGSATESFTIAKKNATITPTAASKTYLEDDPALTATVSGTVAGDTLNYTLSRTTGENAGTYTISVAPGENPNYTVTTSTADFTIKPRTVENPTITLAGESDTFQYDENQVAAPRVYLSFEFNDTTKNIDEDEYTATYKNNSKPSTEGNPATVTVADVDGGNYIITFNPTENATKNFTIVPGEAYPKVVPTAKSGLTYDGTNQELITAGTGAHGTIRYRIGTTGEWSESVPTARDAGTYTVYYMVEGNANYTNWYGGDENGQSLTVTIAKKDLTITADGDSKTYDGTPLARGTYTNTDLASGDTIKSVAFDGSQTEVGESYNWPKDAVIVNASNETMTGNYNIHYAHGTLKILARPLTITADSDAKVYDGTSLTKNSYTSENLADGETIASVTVTGSQTAAGSSDNVPSAAVIKRGDADVTSNYTITYAKGTLTVNKKDLTITADSDSKTYDGTALTKGSYTNGDLAAGDKITSVTVMGSQTAAGSSDNVPSVAVIKNGNGEGDDVTASYDITYTNGSLTVNEKALADDMLSVASPVTYTGSALEPEVTVTDQDPTIIEASDYAVSYSNNTNAGTATVTVTATDAGNYSGSARATFTIAKATPTAGDFVFTAPADTTFSGTAKEAAVAAKSGVTGMGEVAVTYYDSEGNSLEGAPTNIGTYTVKASVAEGSNYLVATGLTAESWTFTIAPKAVTVKADAKSKTYGADDPELTATVTGLVGSDTVSYGFSRAEGEDVGTYTITPSGETSQGNYSVTYVTGTLTITQATATVRADAKSKTYGEADPAFTAAITGLQRGDTESVISYNLARTDGEDVGSYTITPTGEASQGNYTVIYETGSLTINKKAITVTADDKSKTYGAADPELTATVTGLVGTDTVSYTVSREAGENVKAGGYAITPTGAETQGNYTVTYETGTLTINKADSSVTTVPTAKEGLVYASSDQVLVNEGVASGGTMKYLVSTTDTTPTSTEGFKVLSDLGASATDAGTYNVWYYVAGDANHKDTAVLGPVEATIAQKAATLSLSLANVSPAYKGSVKVHVGQSNIDWPVSYSLPEADAGKLGLSLDGFDLVIAANDTTADITSGTFTVTVSARGMSANYSDPAPQTVTVQVQRGTIVAAVTNSDLPYTGEAQTLGSVSATDGSDQAAIGDATIRYSAETEAGRDASALAYGRESAPTATDAGTYAVYYQVSRTNYETLTGSYAMRITQADNEWVSRPAISGWTYGGTPAAPTSQARFGADTVTYAYYNAAGEPVDDIASAGAGSYSLVASVPGTDDYKALTSGPVQFTIAKAPLTVTANAASVTYGDEAPAPGSYTASYSGFVGSDNESALAGTLAFACDYAKGDPVGSYAITPSGLMADNYEIAFVPGTLTVGKKALADAMVGAIDPVIYTGEAKEPAVTVSDGDLLTASDYTVSYSSNVNAGEGTATATVTATEAGNYSGSASRAFTIKKAAQAVTIDQAASLLEWLFPDLNTLAASTNGGGELAVASSDEDVVTAAVSGGTVTMTPHKDGAATITVTAAETANYLAGSASVEVTVQKGKVTATAPVAQDLTYNGAAQELVSAGAATNGTMLYRVAEAKPATTEGFSAALPEGTAAGTYHVYWYVKGNASYADSGIAGPVNVTIGRAAVTVAADDASKTYGEEDPELTATVTGLQGEDAADVLTYAVARAAGEDAGTYAIAASGEAAQGNYSVSYRGATFTIGKAAGSETAPTAKSLTYNGGAQALVEAGTAVGGTMMYAVADAKPEATEGFSAEVPTATAAGSYRVWFYEHGDQNHTDVAIDGPVAVTIAPKAATVTPEDASKTYGADDPKLTATVTGLVGTDTVSYALARAAGENAGTYAIDATGEAAQGNYAVSFGHGTFTIGKAAATETAPTARSLTYTGEAQELVTAGIAEGGTMLYQVSDTKPTGTDGFAAAIPAATDAGDYYVWYYERGDQNHTDIPVDGPVKATIAKAAQVVTLSETAGLLEWLFPDARTFRAATSGDGALAAASSDEDVVTAAIEASGKVTLTPHKDGKATVTVTAAETGNHKAGSASVEVTVAKGQIAATAAAATGLTYTGRAQSLGAVSVASPEGATVRYGVGTDECAAEAAEATKAGAYTVHYEVTKDSYVTASGSFEATIAPKAATIAAADASKTYGEADPALTATVTGAVAGEALSYTVSRKAGEGAGAYAISVAADGDAAVNANYDITTTGATFTVSKRAATIAAADASKAYGEADPALTATVTGAVAGETLAYTVTRKAGEDAGTYAISVSADKSAAANANYDITATGATFTIGKAPATAEDPIAKTLTYAGAAQELVAAGKATGGTVMYLASDAKPTSTTGFSAAIPTGTDAGGYHVYWYVKADANHTDSDVAGPVNVTIKRAAATVAAGDASKTYGEADPELTATVTGLQGSDTAEVLTYALARAAGEDAGTYAIIASGEAAQGNYTVSYQGGTLTIGKAAGSETAPTARALTYNGTAQELVTAGTAVGGTMMYAVADAKPETTEGFSAEVPTATAAGSYRVWYYERGDQNHTDVAIDGPVAVTIAPKAATVTPDDASKTYGADDPRLTATVTGLVGTDTVSYTLARAAGENAGTYAIDATGEAAQGNYAVSFGHGTFTIGKAAAAETAPTARSLTYTGEAQELVAAGTAEGGTMLYQVSDTKPAGTEGFSAEVPTATDAGDYYVWYYERGDQNHTDIPVDGPVKATIAKAPATIAVDDVSKTYGEADPAFTAEVTGLVGEDALDYTLARADGEDAGAYAITATVAKDSAANANYDIATTAGTLTIVPKDETAPEDVEPTVTVAEDGSTTTTVDTLDITLTPTEAEDREYEPGTLVVEGVTLVEGVDYDVAFAYDPEGTTGVATFTFKGNYSGTAVAEFREPSYVIVEQSAEAWIEGSDEGLSLRCNGHFAKFQKSDIKVTMDGMVVDPANFGAREGSTIVALNAAYLGTLPEGEHTVAVYYPDGHASTTFEVKPASSGDDAGADDSGKDDAGADDSGKDDAGTDDSGKGDAGTDDSGKGDAGTDDTGKGDAGTDDTGKDDTGKDDTGKDAKAADAKAAGTKAASSRAATTKASRPGKSSMPRTGDPIQAGLAAHALALGLTSLGAGIALFRRRRKSWQ